VYEMIRPTKGSGESRDTVNRWKKPVLWAICYR